MTVRQVLRRPAKYRWHRRISGRVAVEHDMKKPTHCTTLRLSPDVAEAVENRAYERGCSQANWIRRAIRRALVEDHENEMRRLGSAPNLSDSLGKR